jgi:NUDE protein, C-terminal conserved region
MLSDDIPSSPAALRQGATLEEELAYYKAQYEQLEFELNEFQASSRELEAELERDIEQADKRERELQDKVDSARYEVEEWKTKYKQSKTESTSAQSTLQKEITTLRDANRTLTLKLRDVEVANDAFERQARHTAGSLEDLEGKYNVAIERGVMLEEEIRNGEKEREELRIDFQRVKDELGDLRVETEITQEKLRNAEIEIQRLRSRKITPLGQPDGALRPPSPQYSEASTSATTMSSPTVSTPPPPGDRKGDGTLSVQSTPPSPPLSDSSTPNTTTRAKKPTVAELRKKTQPQTPSVPLKKRSSTVTNNSTPRPSFLSSSTRAGAATAPRHTRGPSVPQATPSASRMQPPASTSKIKPPSRPSFGYQDPLPRSSSLYQIRGLTAKIQNLEKRVHTVRSKLPAPTTTPPRASPRGSTAGIVPSTVTVRSNRKRQSQSTNASSGDRESMAAPVSRLSFGPGTGKATGTASGIPSRPSSRTSMTSSQVQYARPSSRTSMSGVRTPISSTFSIPERSEGNTGHPSQLRRPRSSVSGSYAQTHGHVSRQSISGRSSALDLRSNDSDLDINTAPLRSGTPNFGRSVGHAYSNSTSGRSSAFGERTNDEDNDDSITPTALRRSTIEKGGITGIPAPTGIPRRQSGGGTGIPTLGRRQSSGTGVGEMRPPSSHGRSRALSGVEETY